MEFMRGLVFVIFGISVISVMIAGFQYIMGGSRHELERAKMKIMYSSVGMMSALMASAVLSLMPEFNESNANAESVVKNASDISYQSGYDSKKQIVVEDKKIVEKNGFASTSYVCVVTDGYTDLLFTKTFSNHVDAESFCGGFNEDYRYTVGVIEGKDGNVIEKVYY